MKRSGLLFAPAVVAVAGIGAFALGGCPIYSADSCADDPNCSSVQPYPTGQPYPTYDSGTPPPDTNNSCGSCGAGYVCSNTQTGYYECVAYDCRAPELACATGEQCNEATPGVWSCQTPVLDCTTTGCIAGYACVTDPLGDGTTKKCESTDPNACVADADCATKTGAGSLCLGGTCKAPKDLCSDGTQCAGGKSCADGRCTTSCTASETGTSTCESGYSCNATAGLCSDGAGACGGTSTPDGGAPASCDSSSTCVNTLCVLPCATDASCPSGLVCVAGGCVRDDRPIFFCDQSGTADGTQDVCATGSICLHHNCYITCAGPQDTKTCASADKYNVCKSVTTSSGAHNVCGSSSNLGSDCDPTSSPPKTCAGAKICVDGFCK